MNENHRDLISITFTVLVVSMAAFVAHRFMVPLVWAGIIAIASWPIFKKIESFFRHRRTLSAAVLTIFITLVVAIPLLWLTLVAIQEAKIFVRFVMVANTKGLTAPTWLADVPRFGGYLTKQWNDFIGGPQGIANILSQSQSSIKTFSDFLKLVGLQLANRTMIFGFAVLCLFFFYRDGEHLAAQIDALGDYCLKDRWSLYAHQLPGAINATVNGVVLVGIAVGVIMGIAYGIVGVPLAAFLGALTAVLAMIPFGAPLIFVIAAMILVIKSSFISAIVLLAIGTLVMFIADHVVRPALIGGQTQLHFLAVLFGILGGVETLGIVGLFIGPVVMVLFATLWAEPELTQLKK